jgi:hypothetical protein
MTSKRPLSRPSLPEHRRVNAKARARAALSAAAKARLALDRRKQGRLRDRVVSPKTLKRYEKAMKSFFKWARALGFSIPERVDEFDILLCQYAEVLWSDGDSKCLLADCLSGLMHTVPPLRWRLNGSWRLHAAWRKAEPSKQVPPLTTTMAQGIAGGFVKHGWAQDAVGILLGFHCILRTGELLDLLVGDILFGKEVAILVLRDTTIGGRTGVHQEVEVSDLWIYQRLLRMMAGRELGDHVMGSSGKTFRRRWRTVLQELGIPAKFTPYGIRRGGATALFQHTGKYDMVMQKGRWASMKSMKLYVNAALAFLASDAELDAWGPLCQRYSRYLHQLP